jgi:hypothetical protein
MGMGLHARQRANIVRSQVAGSGPIFYVTSLAAPNHGS